MQSAGGRVEFAGEPPSQFAFLEEITAQQAGQEAEAAEVEQPGSWHGPIAWVGRTSVQQLHQAVDAVGYLGRIAVTAVRSLRPRHLRVRIHHAPYI